MSSFRSLKLVIYSSILILVWYLVNIKLFKEPSVLSSYSSDRGDNLTENGIKKEDIIITFKTTRKNHNTRLRIISQTWFNLAPSQISIISDAEVMKSEVAPPPSPDIPNISTRVRVTKCGPTHSRPDLKCKMAKELNVFLESKGKWWCHVDDDNYLNVDMLLQTLSRYDHNKYWYLGGIHSTNITSKCGRGNRRKFKFATGGAGVCISHSAISAVMKKFNNNVQKMWKSLHSKPDDVALGHLMECTLRIKKTIQYNFHSHYEDMRTINETNLRSKVTVAYENRNVPSIPNLTKESDPSRMLSVHCFLYPGSLYCKEHVNTTDVQL